MQRRTKEVKDELRTFSHRFLIELLRKNLIQVIGFKLLKGIIFPNADFCFYALRIVFLLLLLLGMSFSRLLCKDFVHEVLVID
jgi:hypothetical protein